LIFNTVKLPALKGWDSDIRQCSAARYETYSYRRTQGTGYFLHDKMIAPVFLNCRRLLPPGKANCGVSFRESDGCHQQAAKCKGVAAASQSSR
jgi:hypothetical protein